MDSILSTVLSIFSHNPIIVLGIIAYVAFSIIRGKNSEESDEYESYESSSSGMTWEDMEREYGISIERKVEEPSAQDLLYDDSEPSENHVEEHPNDDTSKTVLAANHHYDEAVTTKQGTDISSKSASSKSTSFSTSTTRLGREAVTGAPLNERLAEFKRDKASKEGRVLVETVGVTTAPAVTSTRSRKSNHALKEGMKWSIILGKPKALERRYR
ncbi:hypothetical protein [uncultured Veillonella sp.]|uniref:hypothetical protein n=1 Tax=uncultured Veillonella sp. TaxID=159268 RepID=UPI0026294036|nr:hypothetical protein [uncultured Veillonella sp.]